MINKNELKLVSILLALALIPLVIIIILNNTSSLKIAKQNAKTILQDTTRAKEEALNNYLDSVMEKADYIAKRPETVELTQAFQGKGNLNLLKSDAEIKQAYEDVSLYIKREQDAHWGKNHHIFITDTNGYVFLSPPHGDSTKSHSDHNISSHPFFKRSLESTQITDFFSFSEASHYHQLLMQPIKSDTKKTLGILVVEICIDYVKDILNRDFTLGETGKIFLSTVDKKEVVATKDEEIKSLRSEGLNVALKQNFACDEYRLGEKIILGCYIKHPKWDWILTTEIDKDDIYSDAYQILKSSIINSAILFIISAIIIFGLVSIFIKKLIIAPIKIIVSGLSSNANKVSDSSSQIAQNTQSLSNKAAEQVASLEEVSASLNKMTDSSQETFKITKDAEELMRNNIEMSEQSLNGITEMAKSMKQIES